MHLPEKGRMGGLERIRERLDPCCRYVVFEKDASPPGEKVTLDEAADLITPFENGVQDISIYNDIATGKRFMVCKLNPDEAEEIQRSLLNKPMPRDLVVYFYGDAKSGGISPETKQ